MGVGHQMSLEKEKNMFNVSRILSVILVVVISYGCSTNKVKPDADTSSTADSSAASVTVEEAQGGVTSGIDDNADMVLDALDDPASDLFVRTIYFDYDSANIRDDSIIVVREHGKYLAANGQRRIRLEGHADERGTREYNLALGEQRAKSVREIMLIQGALPEQIEIVSFGEERPAVDGEDEAALQLNRRVEVVY